MSFNPFWRSTALVLSMLLAACAGRTQDPFSGERTAPTQIQLNVENQNFNDLRVFSVTTRGRMFLGQVNGHASRTFDVDWRGLDEIRIRMEFLAGDDYESNPVNANPGDRLYLLIPQEPRNAYLRRR